MYKKIFSVFLGLMILALLPMACRLTNETGQTRLAVDADTSLLRFDPVLILLRDGAGTDTLFSGKLQSLDTLQRLADQSYAGGKALIIIRGYQSGQLAYEEHRDFDGSTGRATTTITLDLSRPSNSFGALDIRPDVIKLYAGGASKQIEITPVERWQGSNLVWSTGNPGVATVSQSGVLTPVGTGVTYVRAVSGDSAGDASAVSVVRDTPVLDIGSADTVLAAGSFASFEVKVTQEYGDVAAFAWDLDGDGVYEDSLAGAAGQTLFNAPVHAYTTAGEVLAHFRVRDGEGNIVTASKRVKVAGSAPVIDSLIALPALINIKDSVAFSALASGHGATLLSFAWDFDGDGKDDVNGSLQGTSATVRGGYRFPTAGNFQALLRVSDAAGMSVTAKVLVVVKLDKPTADAGPDISVLPGATVKLHGVAVDSLGTIVKREWKIGAADYAAASDSGAIAFTAPATPGDIVCAFRVMDDDGLTAEDSLKVTVNDSKAPSLTALLPKDTVVSIKDSVTFLSSAMATDLDLKSYSLDEDGDGIADQQGVLSGRTAAIKGGHRYLTAGSFNVTLKVLDQSGKLATSQSRVVVKQDAPNADAGPDTVVAIGSVVNLHGKGTDSLGSVVLLEWKIGAGSFAAVSKGDTSFTAPMVPGTVSCVFRVTDDDGNSTSDTASITISPSMIADLSGLTLSSGTLAPVFAAKDTAYSASVANSVTSFVVTPTLASALATMKVNGNIVVSGAASDAIPLLVGNTVIIVAVTAQDGTTKKNYKVTVTRAASGNADLSNLVASVGALSPAFIPATAAYSVTVPNGTPSITVTPTAAGATIKVNGTAVASGSASGVITLGSTATVITIAVTAADGVATQSYSVTVIQAASSNADLTALTTTAGTLSPVFASATLAYAVAVSNGTATTTVTPTTAGSTIKVNTVTVTSGTASAAIPLNVGANPISIVVTAADGVTTKTYTLTVTRAASANADLSTLTTTAGTLTPVFAAASLSYSATVPYATSSITVTPTAAGPTGTTIKVDTTAVVSGTASGFINLAPGGNAISIIVTAANGTATKTYTLNVTRSNSEKLATLTLPVGMTFNQAFNPDILTYYITATATATACKFTPTAADAASGATIAVDGAALTSGTQSPALAYPYSTVTHTIVVTAPDGVATRTYTLNVWRKEASTSPLTGYALIYDVTTSRTLATSASGGTDQFYNPAGDVQFTVTSTGKYTVTFLGLATLANAEGLVHVTASGSDVGSCKVIDWTSTGSVSARIACYDQYGLSIDRSISILVLFPRGSGSGHNAYVWADKPTASGTYVPYPGRSWNDVSGFDGNVVQHVSAGTYTVTFKGQGSVTDPGSVMVTAYGSNNAHCGVSSQTVSGGDLNATVTCRTHLGGLTDAAFNASLMKEYSNTDFGVAMGQMNGTTLGYTFNSSGVTITTSLLSPGFYYISVGGMGSIGPGRNGELVVTPSGSEDATCLAGAWADWGGGDYVLAVRCFDGTGAAANEGINFLFIK